MKQILKERLSEKVAWQIIHVFPCKQKESIKREALVLHIKAARTEFKIHWHSLSRQ